MPVIVGIDCAVDPLNVGMALASVEGGAWTVQSAGTGTRDMPPVDVVAEWIDRREPVLLALDAPLGWPGPLGAALTEHRAGSPLPGRAEDLFRRATDRHVRRSAGRQPLDVGADRIARTALAALTLLQELRERIGAEIPLAWDPSDLPPLSAIEVYPAGTLAAHGFPAQGYKKPGQRSVRRQILDGVTPHLDVTAVRETLETDADVLDAAVCALAAIDFLHGKATPPDDPELARREGWIWVRPRSAARDRPAGPD